MVLDSLFELVDICYVNQLQVLEDLMMCMCQFQEGVMVVCMQLLKVLFSCFFCVVCDFFKKFEKNVCLEFEGEVIEVDKMIIEEFSDLLIYMICNCMDYGLEMLVECIEFGKLE